MVCDAAMVMHTSTHTHEHMQVRPMGMMGNCRHCGAFVTVIIKVGIIYLSDSICTVHAHTVRTLINIM